MNYWRRRELATRQRKGSTGRATEAFNKNDYSLAVRAARRVVRVWPLADYAPQAQYIVARCYEAKGQDEKLSTNIRNPQEISQEREHRRGVRREYVIPSATCAGNVQALGYIPSSVNEKTAGMFEKIVNHGPYSDMFTFPK